nr:hypothetical protein Iba_scaffold3426CG0050 [Ipomoea batatas]GME05826.1 hypothetical protein Iba_scaffold3431CG0030 [Ipomoea batatas]
MDKKKINRKGCRKDRSFRERESGEGESLHKMAAEEQRALFVDGENEVKGAKMGIEHLSSRMGIEAVSSMESWTLDSEH